MIPEITQRLKTRAKIEKNKEVVKPTVINDDLVRQYLIQYNKEHKIFDMNDQPLWELSHLALSYKNIIEIDNLKGLERLTKLQLDNNIIVRIQNIGHLTNLTWLDLSFNLIQEIEGLDTLTNLHDLSLYSNKITELKNLEKLTKLNVLSIGKNLLRNHENAVKYLQSLRNNLEVLKMAENPFQKQGGGPGGAEDYRLYAVEMLKGLKYLDYQLIDQQMRDQAKQKHSDEAQDKDANASGPADDGKNAIDQELIDAKIDVTHKMIEKIQDASEEGQKLKNSVSKYQDNWSNFEQAVDEMTQKYQSEIKVISKEKQRHIAFCNDSLRKAELNAEKESIELIMKFN